MIDILISNTGTQIKDFLSALSAPLQTKADEMETLNNGWLTFSKRNGQKMVMQKAINEIFLQSPNYIYIDWKDNARESAYSFNDVEAGSMYVLNSAELDPLFVLNETEASTSLVDFTIFVPGAIYTTELARRIKYEVNRIKLAGVRFDVQNANGSFARSVIEIITGTTTQAGLASFVSALSEALTATDSQSCTYSTLSARTEATTASHAQDGVNVLRVSLNRTSVSGTGSNPYQIIVTSTQSVTATAGGGTGPYTYEWEYYDGDFGFSPVSVNSATSFFQGLCNCGNVHQEATFRCKVTDNVGAIVYSDLVTVTLTNTETTCS